jgi:hypothetical protein
VLLVHQQQYKKYATLFTALVNNALVLVVPFNLTVNNALVLVVVTLIIRDCKEINRTMG